MSFREIIAEVPNLTEDEKRQLLDLLERELSANADEESPEFLAMLEPGSTLPIKEVAPIRSHKLEKQ